MAVPACCRTARARGAVPTGRQSGRSTSANDQPAHVHRARSCRTAHPVRLAVVPSSTQFLPLNRTESVDFHRFNQRVFQQNRPGADSGPSHSWLGVLSRRIEFPPCFYTALSWRYGGTCSPFSISISLSRRRITSTEP